MASMNYSNYSRKNLNNVFKVEVSNGHNKITLTFNEGRHVRIQYLQNKLIHVVNWYKEHVRKEDSKISMTGYAQC